MCLHHHATVFCSSCKVKMSALKMHVLVLNLCGHQTKRFLVMAFVPFRSLRLLRSLRSFKAPQRTGLCFGAVRQQELFKINTIKLLSSSVFITCTWHTVFERSAPLQKSFFIQLCILCRNVHPHVRNGCFRLPYCFTSRMCHLESPQRTDLTLCAVRLQEILKINPIMMLPRIIFINLQWHIVFERRLPMPI